ncbi:hypothetical protein [Rhodococcus gannanensis]|uniref:Uncharacterized protein n=1 Tax=Rhodococcus gannanensis TaxID=1960308 RepID=A0ABW4NYZ0_9NOCA
MGIDAQRAEDLQGLDPVHHARKFQWQSVGQHRMSAASANPPASFDCMGTTMPPGQVRCQSNHLVAINLIYSPDTDADLGHSGEFRRRPDRERIRDGERLGT